MPQFSSNLIALFICSETQNWIFDHRPCLGKRALRGGKNILPQLSRYLITFSKYY